MSKFDLTRLVISISVLGIILVVAFCKLFLKKNPITTKFIARTSLFAAMSIILYLVPIFKFHVPFFPAFLEIHFDEVPALIAGFAYGPLSGFFVVLIRTIAKLPMTSTMMVGELADFIYSSILVIPSAIIYKKFHNVKGALIGLGVSTILQLIVSAIITTYILLEFYIFMMGWPKEVILEMCQAANPNVNELGLTFMFLVCIPFNAFKDVIIVALTFVLYKNLHKLIDRLSFTTN